MVCLRFQLMVLALGAAVCSAAWSSGQTGVGEESLGTHEVYFELKAEVRSARLDADLWASARLASELTRDERGLQKLSLIEPLEPALKFYWVDPAGPFGEEAKVGAVASLDEMSWDELDRARSDVSVRGEAIHERWQAEHGGRRPLDGTFAFIIVNPPRERFEIVLDADGRVTRVDNQLTERWLPGPFDRFVASSATAPHSEGPDGYWFWNDGETEPFSYEPHVYHAFARALRLLSAEMPASDERIRWPDLARGAVEVVATLAPGAERSLAPDTPPLTVLGSSAEGGVSAQTATGANPAASRSVSVFEGRESDELELTWTASGFDLWLRVGYRPHSRTIGSNPQTAR